MLALIAGTGALPAALIARLPTPPLVLALRGFQPTLPVDITFRIEHLGTILGMLRDRGVSQVCMAGAVRRPEIDLGEVDAATAPLIPVIMSAIAQGDDGALRAVIAVFEEAGLDVVGAHQIAPDLLPEAGLLSKMSPPPDAHADAAVAEACVAEMGQGDLGQACVVRGGQVLLREDSRGTDAMLAPYRPSDLHRPDMTNPLGFAMDLAHDALGDAADWLSGSPSQIRGAILFKAPKPGQERRADLPVIGPQTAVAAHDARLSGIVVEAGGVMVLDLAAVLHICDSFGMFFWVRPRGGG